MEEAENEMQGWTQVPFEFEDSPMTKIVMIKMPDGFNGCLLYTSDISEMVNFTAPQARAFGIKASEPFFKLMNMRQVTIAAVSYTHLTLLFRNSRSLRRADIRTSTM